MCGPSRGGLRSHFFDQETRFDPSADAGADQLERLMLVDGTGRVTLEVASGDEPSSAIIAPGNYVLELHHRSAGDGDLPTQTIFLQPVAQADTAPAASPRDALPPCVEGIQARADCIRCSFARAELRGQNFDGVKLIGSNFDGARIMETTFRGAIMDDCIMTRLVAGIGVQRAFDADFSGAFLTGAPFSFEGHCFGSFTANFQGAHLENTTWDGNFVEIQRLCDNSSWLAADFRNASVRNGKFRGVQMRSDFLTKATCMFQGADLTGADFTEPNRATPTGFVSKCDFSKEAGSGRVTRLIGANLSGATFIDTNLADADLSGATLKGTKFSNPTTESTKTNLSRANLTGAVIDGVRLFRGVSMFRAVLANVSPPTLNGFDLTGTTLSGIDLAGIDLSQADLSKAVLITKETVLQDGHTQEVTVLPDFSRAKLSDGNSRGVILSGVTFPPLTAAFKGLNLTAANLEKMGLFEADLEGTTLDKARLVGANLNFANLHGAKLRGTLLGVQPGTEAVAASLRGAFMTDVDLSDADLRSVDLTGVHLYGDSGQTKLIRTRLDSANLTGSICSGAHFSGTLNNAVFNDAQLVNTVFNGATLTGAKLNDTYLEGADFSAATSVTGVSLSNAAIAAQAGTWTLTEQDGTPFTILYEATKLGALASNSTVRCPNGESGPCCPNGDLQMCLLAKLKPLMNGPFPPVPACVPKPPRYDNCLPTVPN